MREKLRLEQIRCDGQVMKLSAQLAPLKGLHEARMLMGASELVVEYDDATGPELEAAIDRAGLWISERSALAPGALA